MLTIWELITELQKIEKDYGSQVKIIGKTEFGIGWEEGNKTVTHKWVNLYFSWDGNDKPVDTTYIELSFDEITIETKVSVSI